MVYNQKYLPPRKPGLQKYLQNYVPYIAKQSQSHVALNESQNHGLFGCIQNTYLPKDIESLRDATKYIIGKSQDDKCILYHGFISLSAGEVIQQGYANRQKWEQLLAAKMSDVAKANHIKIENLEWVSALHVKKDHSHCHLIFWDKRQGIKEPHIPKQAFEQKMEWLRGRFARSIFPEQFKELYQQKDGAFETLRDAMHPFFDEFGTLMDGMTEGEYMALKKQLSALSPDYADEKMINPKISYDQLKEITRQIIRIREIIPKTGSLKYQYIPQGVKEKLDEASLQIIHANAACRSAYYAYLRSAKDIRKVYADNPESLEEAEAQARSVILKSVGNKVLQAAKTLDDLEREPEHKNQPNNEREAAHDLFMQIAFMLSRGAQNNNARASRLRTSELSRQAKIELAKKLEDKSLDWGQYER